MDRRNKSATLHIRLDPDLKDAAGAACDAEGRRSLSSLVVELLTDHLHKGGWVKGGESEGGIWRAGRQSIL